MKRTEALATLGEMAASQSGLITSAQAKALGVDGVTLMRLRDADLLRQVGHGVYLVGGAAEPTHLDIRVAWLRLDPARPAWERDGLGEKDGVVSHASACLVHEIGDIPAPQVELTVPRRVATRESWVKLHRHNGPLPAKDVTRVGGLPVTTAVRTVLDLLRAGADAGHVGGVIAAAERRGLLDLDALAQRAGRYADRYAMGKASGAELISALTTEAGEHLQRDKALEVLSGAAAAGYEDAIRHLLHIQLPSTSHDPARLPARVQQELARLVAAQVSPAVGELGKIFTENLAAQLSPFQEAAGRVVAAQAGPAITEINRQLNEQIARQLRPLLEDSGLAAARREQIAEVILPNEAIATLLERAAASQALRAKITPADEAHDDEESNEADS